MQKNNLMSVESNVCFLNILASKLFPVIQFIFSKIEQRGTERVSAKFRNLIVERYFCELK